MTGKDFPAVADNQFWRVKEHTVQKERNPTEEDKQARLYFFEESIFRYGHTSAPKKYKAGEFAVYQEHAGYNVQLVETHEEQDFSVGYNTRYDSGYEENFRGMVWVEDKIETVVKRHWFFFKKSVVKRSGHYEKAMKTVETVLGSSIAQFGHSVALANAAEVVLSSIEARKRIQEVLGDYPPKSLTSTDWVDKL